MSIELKEAAQQVVDAFDAFGDADDFASLFELTQKMRALRTAIQQAEAQQPATGEPVVSRNPFASRCYTMSESHLSGYRLIVGFEKLEDAQDAHEWVARQGRGDSTHQAPGVPVGFTYQAEIDYANSTGGNGSFWRVPPDLDDEAVPLYDHPAPSVPGDDFDLICNAIDKADTITMEGDYMLDSDDCIAVVRVMQVLLSVRAAMLAAK